MLARADVDQGCCYAVGMAQIRTQRLLLRPATSADLLPIHSILSDARATRFLVDATT